jgi:hypothetical protein
MSLRERASASRRPSAARSAAGAVPDEQQPGCDTLQGSWRSEAHHGVHPDPAAAKREQRRGADGLGDDEQLALAPGRRDSAAEPGSQPLPQCRVSAEIDRSAGTDVRIRNAIQAVEIVNRRIKLGKDSNGLSILEPLRQILCTERQPKRAIGV